MRSFRFHVSNTSRIVVFTIVLMERANLPHHQFLRRVPGRRPHCSVRTPFLKLNSRAQLPHRGWNDGHTPPDGASSKKRLQAPVAFWSIYSLHYPFRIAVGSFHSKPPNITEKVSIMWEGLTLTGLFVLSHSRLYLHNLKATPLLWAKPGDLELMKCQLEALKKLSLESKGTGSLQG